LEANSIDLNTVIVWMAFNLSRSEESLRDWLLIKNR